MSTVSSAAMPAANGQSGNKKMKRQDNRRRCDKRAGSNNDGNNDNRNNLKKLSHALSWALRHSAVDIGLTIRSDGYVPVQEILESTHPRLKVATSLEQIQKVVDTSDKQRFKMTQRPRSLYYSTAENKPEQHSDDVDEEEPTILCIRANQGHSIDVIEPHLLLTKLSPQQLQDLPCIVHGTYNEPWTIIQQQGLSKMNRTHIHFATGLPQQQQQGGGGGTNGVISGMRKSSTIHIFLDLDKCAAAAATNATCDNDKDSNNHAENPSHQDHLDFFVSDNGVILTNGVNGSGILPSPYFSHVTDSSGKILLDHRDSKDS